jgi:hypothetical protein
VIIHGVYWRVRVFVVIISEVSASIAIFSGVIGVNGRIIIVVFASVVGIFVIIVGVAGAADGEVWPITIFLGVAVGGSAVKFGAFWRVITGGVWIITIFLRVVVVRGFSSVIYEQVIIGVFWLIPAWQPTPVEPSSPPPIS